MSGLPFFLPTFNIASVLCTCISMYVKNMCIVNISLVRLVMYRKSIFHPLRLNHRRIYFMCIVH